MYFQEGSLMQLQAEGLSSLPYGFSMKFLKCPPDVEVGFSKSKYYKGDREWERIKMDVVMSLECSLGSNMPSLVLYSMLVQWGKKLHKDMWTPGERNHRKPSWRLATTLILSCFHRMSYFHTLFCSWVFFSFPTLKSGYSRGKAGI